MQDLSFAGSAPNSNAPEVLPALKLRQVKQTFGGGKGVSVDSLDIAARRITAIIGASGSGKSTFLHLISGMNLMESESGRAEIALTVRSGNQLRQIDALKEGWGEIRREIGFVFQNDHLIGSASGRENLLLSLATAGKAIPDGKLEKLWTELGLDHTGADPDQRSQDYSGGMRQRVAVGRALIREPSILFADEPTANLDPKSARTVMQRLARWANEESHRTLVLVTHDLELASEFADEIVVMVKPGDEVHDLDDDNCEARERPGTLAPGYQFPIANPRNRAVLEQIMYGTGRPQVTAPKQPDAIGETAGGKDKCAPASFLQVVHWVGQVGVAIVTGPERIHGVRSDALNAGLTLLKVFAVLTVFAAGIAAFAVLLVGWLDDSDWPWFSDLADRFGLQVWQVGDTSAGWMWGLGLSFIVFIFYLLQPLFGRLKHSVVADAAVFSTMLTAAVILATAGEYATAAFEEEMSDPSLQPVLVQAGLEPLTDTAIADIEQMLDDLRTQNADSSSDWPRSVFGRYHKLGVQAYLPRSADNADGTVCKGSRSDPVTLNVLAPTAEEPIGSGLGYREKPLTPSSLPDGNSWSERRHLAELAFAKPVDTGRVASVFATAPRRPPEIVLTDDVWRQFAEQEDGTVPQAVCLDMKSTKFDRDDDTAFRVVGLVDRIPKFDVRRYDAVLARDAGALLARREPHREGMEYSLAAIWVDPAHRSGIVREIVRLREDGRLKTLPGFEALRRALVAADQSTATRQYLLLFVLSVGTFIVWRIIAGITNKLSQELAVARAFGARSPHLAALLIAATYRPVFLALSVVMVSVGLLSAQMVDWTYETIPDRLVGQAPWVDAGLRSAAVFIGLWIATIMAYVARVEVFQPSIANQMQDSE